MGVSVGAPRWGSSLFFVWGALYREAGVLRETRVSRRETGAASLGPSPLPSTLDGPGRLRSRPSEGDRPIAHFLDRASWSVSGAESPRQPHGAGGLKLDS